MKKNPRKPARPQRPVGPPATATSVARAVSGAVSGPAASPVAGSSVAAPPGDPATAARFSAALGAHQAGRLEEAESGYRQVLLRAPRHPHALNNLAILMRSTRRYDAALELYRQAQAASPDDAHIYSNFGCLLVDLGRAAEAVDALKRAVTLRPDHGDAYFNLGNCRRDARDKAGAQIGYERAIRLRPGMAEPHAAKGDLHKERGELATAVDCFVTALKARPDMLEPYNNLGETLKEQGRLAEAIGIFQEGVGKHPNNALIHGNLLFALHYTPQVAPDLIHKAHVVWNERHARPLLPAQPRFANDRAAGRRLRVGYVSPDFCTHSCAYFSEALIREHDPVAVEVFCYPTSTREDATTLRFRRMASHWRPLAGVADDAAAALIRQDAIDILVDLAGHTAENRLLVFARKPAPVQVTWLGYPDTTGMTAMDYRLTDAVADPEGVADRRAVERLVRLPGGFLAFQPLIAADARDTPPVLAAGHVTFGSFNNISKLSPEVIRVWSEILGRVDGARLVLKGKAFADPPTRARYAALLAANGIAAERVDLLSRIEPVGNHLRAYDGIDIGLDPFPYNGTTTTCEALWMGVPVITLAGEHHVARVGASLLTQCGLAGFIAGDEADYVAKAVALAGDLSRLTELRRTMRARLERSPLTDYAGFARNVEVAYRRMWQDWLARGAA